MSSPSKPAIKAIPYITIQDDALDAIADVKQGTISAEDVWVSCYLAGSPSVHGKVRVEATGPADGNKAFELEARDGVIVDQVDSTTLKISCPSLSISPTKVLFPRQSMTNLLPSGIECMAVAGDLVATGGKNGVVRVDSWRGEERGKPARFAQGHVGDLTGIDFFPSGQVLLTSSTDLSARIFSAVPSPSAPTALSNPRTLANPHTRSVTASLSLGKGRFVATASRDGALRVWEVKTGKVVTEGTWPGGVGVGVGVMGVGRKAEGMVIEDDPTEAWPPKFLEGWFLALGLSSGKVCFIGLPSLQPLPEEQQPPAIPGAGSSAIDALAISADSSRLALGNRAGVASLFTLSPTVGRPVLLVSWRRTEAAINCIRFDDMDGTLIIGGDDGLPYRAAVDHDGGVEVVEEWAGYDTDPVTDVRVLEGRGFSAGKDGCVVIY